MVTSFFSALPVWPEGREREMNLMAGFRALLDCTAAGDVVLRVTASTLYRAFLDGQFIGYGPARAPHGFFRIDEWKLTLPTPGRNHLLAIEVSAYNINTYYQVNQPAFLQAEVLEGDRVLASTGGRGVLFEGRILTERMQKVERYSVARGFSEIYSLRTGYLDWRIDPDSRFAAEPLAVFPGQQLLERRIPLPSFPCYAPNGITGKGELHFISPATVKRDWTLTAIGPDLLGYRETELDGIPSIEIQGMAFRQGESSRAGDDFILSGTDYRILDFGTNRSGFISLTADSPGGARLWLAFDEILSDGDVDPLRLRCVNIVRCDLPAGSVDFETFEPYTFRYVKVFAVSGECTLSTIRLRAYVSSEGRESGFRSSNAQLNALFEAGIETLRQNSVDLLTDCPSRERAGWLCDSFFLARTSDLVYGNTLHEKNYLENYLLPAAFGHIPAGMVPMCFPADHDNGKFIPNWGLWLVLQLGEYLVRSGDRPMIDGFLERVEKLFEYFTGFENSDGLLENLAGWVFVEWSKANEFVEGVNYPTNMLYGEALRVAGRLFGREAWTARGEAVSDAVREQSFDGEFFADNAVRREGMLVRTANRTEICQYYALTYGIATAETHPVLWGRLKRDFGTGVKNLFEKQGVHPANALLGYPLRFELLSRSGDLARMLDEAVSLYAPMVEKTGTLWEHVDPTASCCHGFASHISFVLLRDVLGLVRVDRIAKQVVLFLRDSGVTECSGHVPVGSGRVSVAWRRQGGVIDVSVSAPDGYHIEVENHTSSVLAPVPRSPGS